MFTAAIFDMDGLLIDSERAIMRAWLEAARRLGVEIEPAGYLRVVGRDARESTAMLTAMCGGEPTYRAAESIALSLIADDRCAPVFPAKRGAAELLQTLRGAGVPCAVASSSRHAEIRHRLGDVGVLHHFDAIAGGDEVPRGKPDPALYRLAAERLGIDAADCIAFEDSENGARAALAAGMRVVVVPDLVRPSDDLVARCFDRLDSLHDALARLPRWFGPHFAALR